MSRATWTSINHFSRFTFTTQFHSFETPDDTRSLFSDGLYSNLWQFLQSFYWRAERCAPSTRFSPQRKIINFYYLISLRPIHRIRLSLVGVGPYRCCASRNHVSFRLWETAIHLSQKFTPPPPHLTSTHLKWKLEYLIVIKTYQIMLDRMLERKKKQRVKHTATVGPSAKLGAEEKCRNAKMPKCQCHMNFHSSLIMSLASV